jgi:hypothetical protein
MFDFDRSTSEFLPIMLKVSVMPTANRRLTGNQYFDIR